MEFGPVPLFIFWDIFKNADNKQVYVYIVQSASRLLHRLINRRLKTAIVADTNQPFVLVASHRKTEEWLPFKVKSADGLKDFSSRVFFSEEPVERIEIKGQNYILINREAVKMQEIMLYAFYPIKIIEDDISRQRRLIFAGILLFIIVALLTGWLPSDIFLIPVARLSEGVVAIKTRNHSFRIEATQKDEFGDLALSF